MGLFANVPSLFLSNQNKDLQTVTDGTLERCSPPSTPLRLFKTKWKWFLNLGMVAQRSKPSNTGRGTHSRCAIERPKGETLFLVWRVDVVAAQNVLTEVLMDHTGVIADPQLP